MKKLNLEHMKKFHGGQIDNCEEFLLVCEWLIDNDHEEQFEIIWDMMPNYCY